LVALDRQVKSNILEALQCTSNIPCNIWNISGKV